MWERFTERARRVIYLAQAEAQQVGENWISTEHLLLGLIREEGTVAERVLEEMGLGREAVLQSLFLGHCGQPRDTVKGLTPRTKHVLDLSWEEAKHLGQDFLGTEHLLLGLIREGEGLAARVLVKLGADLERAREAVRQVQEKEGTRSAGTQGAS